MKCLRCNNTDPYLFAYDHGEIYCRRCCSFGKLPVGQDVKKTKLKTTVYKGKPKLDYDLTPAQKEAGSKACKGLLSGKDVFVYAAAGAGKTEMTFESICAFLSCGKKVCFAISRRQVVIEIAQRLSKAFPDLETIAVCEGFTQKLDADLIVCTTHQLYRYPDSFDLLILDELDAFPYAGNEVLETIARRSCKGVRLLLSATPDEKHFKEFEQGSMLLVQLFKRPHGVNIPEPVVICLPLILQLAALLLFCLHNKRKGLQVLIFVPRKSDRKLLALLFSPFFSCRGIDSSSKDKDEVIDLFRSGRLDLLFSTTLLERGITIPSVQVAVVKGEHSVFTSSSLIQIFGRAGRSFKDPYGKCLCLCSYKSRQISQCASQIHAMNQSA